MSWYLRKFYNLGARFVTSGCLERNANMYLHHVCTHTIIKYQALNKICIRVLSVTLKVCHSSAFQTISRKSVYIKNINHSDSISANLNNTIQTKQHAMKKPHSYSNRNKIYKGLFFVVEGFWAENVQNLQFLLIQ